MRDECGLQGFENRVLRRIFGTTKNEEMGLEKLHNEELYDLYSSSNILREKTV
jgi:hypothetical protein